jgi:glucokinase
MRRYLLGIDIGGMSIRAALIGKSGRSAKRFSLPMDRSRTWRSLMEDICSRVEAGMGRCVVDGIGAGCAGCIDSRAGVVCHSPNLPRWRSAALKAFLEERFNAPCTVDNDVNMAAMGEYRFGAGRGAAHLFCMTIGTGVGGAIIVNGRLYRGAGGSAGEIGHVPVNVRGRACPCGGEGCLERYVCASAIVERARRLMRGKKTALRSVRELTPQVIADAAGRGDTVARAVWERTGRFLGIGLAAVVNLFNPDRIVIGGGIGAAGALLLVPARKSLRTRGLRIPVGAVTVCGSALGADAALLGAVQRYIR